MRQGAERRRIVLEGTGAGLSGWTDHDSLIWSLLTNSTDRAAQSLGTQTIKLSSNSYNALTEDEISQIEAKGYTLTHS